jgi:peptidoglycan/LPS O-acetylase OafA/YrhL
MVHSVGSLEPVEKTRRQLSIQFPSRLIELEHGDGLGAVRGVAWCLLFEVAILITVALAWVLWHVFDNRITAV